MKTAIYTYINDFLEKETESSIDSFLVNHENFNGDIVILYSKYERPNESAIINLSDKYKAIFKEVSNKELDSIYLKLKTESNPKPVLCKFLLAEALGQTGYDCVYAMSPHSTFINNVDRFTKMGNIVFFKKDFTYREEKKMVLRQGPTIINRTFFIVNKEAMNSTFPSFLYKNLMFNTDFELAMTYFLVNYLSGRCSVKILENTAFPMVENFANQAFQIFLGNQPKIVGIDSSFYNNVNPKNYLKFFDFITRTKKHISEKIKDRLVSYSPFREEDSKRVNVITDIPDGIRYNVNGQNEKLCIVVPFRNRDKHLETFIPYMSAYLEDVNNIKDYQILIVEQGDNKPFNRAKLFNAGIKESPGFDYYCFHDVDMIPLEADYSYVPNPFHLAIQCEQFNYTLPYDGYWGGVLMVPNSDLQKVNGWCNEFWGWGAEDDEFYYRLLNGNCNPTRSKIGRYRSLTHEKIQDPILKVKNQERFEKSKNLSFSEQIKDGLSTSNYTLVKESGYGKIKFITVKL